MAEACHAMRPMSPTIRSIRPARALIDFQCRISAAILSSLFLIVDPTSSATNENCASLKRTCALCGKSAKLSRKSGLRRAFAESLAYIAPAKA